MPNRLLPPQVLRIVLLAAGIVVSYIAARYLLTPPSFGEHGFYRGAALGEIAGREPEYAGRKACLDCHEEVVTLLGKHEHKTLGCEVCHGPCQEHTSPPNTKPQVPTYSHCVRCHEKNVSRPKWHKQIDPKDHFAGQKCTECHVPHNPTEVP
jgi:hypothetical protein